MLRLAIPHLDEVGPGLPQIPFGQCTGIEEPDQIRSARSSLTASEKLRPLPLMGLVIGGTGFAWPVTTPCIRKRARRASTARPADSIGITFATGLPRSVMVKMRPSRTRRR